MRPIAALPPPDIEATLSRRDGLVDLWWLEGTLDDSARAHCEAAMSDEERARHAQFRFAEGRDLHAAARWLVRTTLSRYAPVDPQEWRFGAEGQGRPFVAHPALATPLHFNLSHTRGLVVCAVSGAHAALGVDVERRDRRNISLRIAERFFARAEVEDLRALPEGQQRERFLSIWTLKESYVKARGGGLTIPLDVFAFDIDGERAEVHFDDRLREDADRWRFALLDAPPGHLLAVGAETGGAPLTLRASRVQP